MCLKNCVQKKKREAEMNTHLEWKGHANLKKILYFLMEGIGFQTTVEFLSRSWFAHHHVETETPSQLTSVKINPHHFIDPSRQM